MGYIIEWEEGEDGLSGSWWRRQRRYDQWFNDFLDDASKMEKDLDEMLHRVFGNPDEKEKARKRCSSQFGKPLTSHPNGSRINEELEPLIDVFDDGTNIIIVAELLGVDKDCINLQTTEDTLTISLDSPEGKHEKEIDLPTRVDAKASTSRLKNGVLEVRLKKLSEKLVIE